MDVLTKNRLFFRGIDSSDGDLTATVTEMENGRIKETHRLTEDEAEAWLERVERSIASDDPGRWATWNRMELEAAIMTIRERRSRNAG